MKIAPDRGDILKLSMKTDAASRDNAQVARASDKLYC